MTSVSKPRVQVAVERLAEFLGGVSSRDFSPAVRAQAGLIVRDTCGAILGGSLEPEIRALAARPAVAVPGEATILGPGFPRVAAPLAALVNATAGTFLELDEYHSPAGHPAVQVLPAVLALGERLNASGEQVLEAFVVGYEVAARVSRATAFHPTIHDHGHSGTVGSAVGCGKLLGFGGEDLLHAIDIAACLTLAAPWRTTITGSTVRNLFAGVSSQVGMLAAEAAASGFTGLVGGIEETFGSILGESVDPAALSEELGEPFEIMGSRFKLYACCASTHPAVQAALDLRQSHGLRAEDILEARILAHPRAYKLAIPDPPNQLAAKFSLPFAVATALVRGQADRAAFMPAAIADAGTRALSERIEVVQDSELSQRYPDRPTTMVELVLRDGRRVAGFSAHPRVWERTSKAELTEKFTALVEPLLPGDAAVAAAASLEQLGSFGSVRDLTAALSERAAAAWRAGASPRE